MLRSTELLYLLTINVIAPQLLEPFTFLIPAMNARFWAMVVLFCCSAMHEYFPIDAKPNTVLADHLWNLNCPKHYCLYAPYAFERVYNTNSCSGNHQINADVMETELDTKKPSSTAGFF